MSEKHSEHTVETSVNYKKVILFICMAVMLELLLCLFVFPPPKAAEPVTLNVALYGYIPDYGSFEDTVRESWEEAHPEVKLHFVQWDCYESVVPDDLDVFVFDAINLDVFADAGSLLPLSEEDIEDYDDLIPSFMNGFRIDGTIYAVPQLLCTDFLFTRKSDTGMSEIKSIDGLYHALGDSGLLTDYRSDRTKVILYLQALIDEAQVYMDTYPKVEEGTLSERAVLSLAQIRDLRDTDPEGVVDKNDRYYYARRFSSRQFRWPTFSASSRAATDICRKQRKMPACCRASDQSKYRAIFNAVRGNALRH